MVLAPLVIALATGTGTPILAKKTVATIGNTTFATFLIPFHSLLRKNSGIPVSGLMLFNSLPTMYRSGSNPISRSCS